MKLKVKNLDWLAGKPSIILSRFSAEKLGVKLNDRITLIYNSKKLDVAIDITSRLVKKNELGLSEEVKKILSTKQGTKITLKLEGAPLASKLIKKKINGKRLSKKEIKIIVSEIAQNKLTGEETTYFVAAEKINGLSKKELKYLIEAMLETGGKISFDKKIIADKHCIGGIAGNRTTPLVVAICAAAGLMIPKNSSRAITSAAGTADVIETLSKVNLSPSKIKKIVEKTNGSLVWGGGDKMVSADSRIITIERVLNLDVEPQMLASIISKKLAAGSTRLILDLPYGVGAKLDNLFNAKKLGKKFKKLGKEFGINIKPVYTDGRQPIGNGIGPVLEMKDVLKILKGKEGPKDLREKAIFLSAELMNLCGIKDSRKKAEEILNSGKAYKKFKEIINAQNGVRDFDKRIRKLRVARYSKTILVPVSGNLYSIDNKQINSLCRVLGNPEVKNAGVYLYKHLGEVKKGEELITIYARSEDRLKEGLKFYRLNNPFKIK